MSQFFLKQSSETRSFIVLVIAFLTLTLSQQVLAAPATTGFGDACDNVVAFFTNFETILKAASVIIVTIAIVFAGYQIAFAHKRLSDVAPILVGGLLIGGAAAIASWFTEAWAGGTTC